MYLANKMLSWVNLADSLVSNIALTTNMQRQPKLDRPVVPFYGC